MKENWKMREEGKVKGGKGILKTQTQDSNIVFTYEQNM